MSVVADMQLGAGVPDMTAHLAILSELATMETAALRDRGMRALDERDWPTGIAVWEMLGARQPDDAEPDAMRVARTCRHR